MAIGKSPLLENLSGKIGNLIIYQMNGKTVIRQKLDPEKKRKLSPLQLYYQRSFRVCQGFLRPLNPKYALANLLRLETAAKSATSLPFSILPTGRFTIAVLC